MNSQNLENSPGDFVSVGFVLGGGGVVGVDTGVVFWGSPDMP